MNIHLLNEVSDIKDCIARIEGDLREIKVYVKTEKKGEDRQFSVKVMALASAFALISSVVLNLIWGS